ncbi:uncharacterized protein LOC132645955 isoform X6 [Lycium barbarum]|uniref:uncharacterized protein LOC132645955 isoform X6 n=2 Tax=Lycium barbarum TaxID=112863 RepID=UPI00293F0FF5|nr:uncharacterized protein LOC132645955 isoform X6 [Lycium barbarum]
MLLNNPAVGQRSESGDNFGSHFEEGSQIPGSIHRQLYEHYRSHHHNNQVPTDQFVMNRPDVALTSRTTPYSLYDPRYAAIGLPVDPHLRALKRNPNFGMRSVTNVESSTTNDSRTDYARSKVPRLHQSSSLSGVYLIPPLFSREVVEQEHRQSRGDYPRVIRPTPYSLYDPRYAAIGQPVDPLLRAPKQNPNFGMPRATSDEKNEITRELKHNPYFGMPSATSDEKNEITRELKQNPYFGMPSATSDEKNEIIRELKQNPYFGMPSATSDEKNEITRELKQNPYFGMPSATSDEKNEITRELKQNP